MVPASRTSTEFAMANARNCNPSRHCNYPPGDGHILRHQSTDPSCAEAVLWPRVLDRFHHQYGGCRTLASLERRAISNRKDSDSSGLVTLWAPRHQIVDRSCLTVRDDCFSIPLPFAQVQDLCKIHLLFGVGGIRIGVEDG
jgi:hypothetical protein